jgi:hypothetical protein
MLFAATENERKEATSIRGAIDEVTNFNELSLGQRL